jgi:hypothetical protein
VSVPVPTPNNRPQAQRLDGQIESEGLIVKAIHIQAICAKKWWKPRREQRGSLSTAVHKQIWKKTGGTCHICGGRAGKRWQADHVVPWHLGGSREADNYLPICRECNGLRWSHDPKAHPPNPANGRVCKECYQAQHRTRTGNDFECFGGDFGAIVTGATRGVRGKLPNDQLEKDVRLARIRSHACASHIRLL